MRVVEHTINSWEDEDSETGAIKEYFKLQYSPVKLQEDEKQEASQILQEQINQGLFNIRLNTFFSILIIGASLFETGKITSFI